RASLPRYCSRRASQCRRRRAPGLITAGDARPRSGARLTRPTSGRPTPMVAQPQPPDGTRTGQRRSTGSRSQRRARHFRHDRAGLAPARETLPPGAAPRDPRYGSSTRGRERARTSAASEHGPTPGSAAVAHALPRTRRSRGQWYRLSQSPMQATERWYRLSQSPMQATESWLATLVAVDGVQLRSIARPLAAKHAAQQHETEPDAAKQHDAGYEHEPQAGRASLRHVDDGPDHGHQDQDRAQDGRDPESNAATGTGRVLLARVSVGVGFARAHG